MIRPTSWIGGDPVDADLARLDVDGHLGDLDAEREHPHAGRVRAARAVAEDLRVPSRSSRSSIGHEPPSAQTTLPPFSDSVAHLAVPALRRDLEDLAGSVPGCGAHRRPHRRDRGRAGRERGVGPAGRVAELDRDAVERQPELLGGDLRHRRARAGADVLHRRDDRRARVRARRAPTRTRAGRRRRTRSGWRARRRASTVSVERARTSCRRSQCGSARR